MCFLLYVCECVIIISDSSLAAQFIVYIDYRCIGGDVLVRGVCLLCFCVCFIFLFVVCIRFSCVFGDL